MNFAHCVGGKPGLAAGTGMGNIGLCESIPPTPGADAMFLGIVEDTALSGKHVVVLATGDSHATQHTPGSGQPTAIARCMARDLATASVASVTSAAIVASRGAGRTSGATGAAGAAGATGAARAADFSRHFFFINIFFSFIKFFYNLTHLLTPFAVSLTFQRRLSPPFLMVPAGKRVAETRGEGRGLRRGLQPRLVQAYTRECLECLERREYRERDGMLFSLTFLGRIIIII